MVVNGRGVGNKAQSALEMSPISRAQKLFCYFLSISNLWTLKLTLLWGLSVKRHFLVSGFVVYVFFGSIRLNIVLRMFY